MKRLLLLVALVATVGAAVAQEGKAKMLVDYFTYSSSTNGKYADAVRNQVIAGITDKNRLTVIDVDSEATLRIEAERRSQEQAMGDAANRNEIMRSLNATYALNGNVDHITVTRKRTDSGQTYYDAEVVYTLKVVNVADGTLKASKAFKSYGGGSLFSSGETSEKAIAGAITSIADDMHKFIDIHFPLSAKIVDLKEHKKGALKSCYVNLGSDHGISPGQYITVFHLKQIAGRETKVEIGRMKVDEVIAGDLCDCSVTKGGKEIYAIITDANGRGVDELALQTQEKAGMFGALGL